MKWRRRSARDHVVILLENLPLARDSRVRRQCRTLVDAGYDVTVICPRLDGSDGASVEGVAVRSYPRRDATTALGFLAEYVYSLAASAWLLVMTALRGRIDVVQLCNPPDVLWMAAIPFRLFGTKIVFDHHDLSPELFENRFGRRGVLYRVLLLMERISVRVAHRVIESNETMAAIVSARSSVARHTLAVVRNGPRLGELSAPTSGRISDESTRPFTVLWHGIMGSEDGLDLVVAAAAALIHDLDRTDCDFVLVGDGDVRRDIEGLVRESGLEGWVHFTGWLDEEGVRAHLARADIGLSADPSNGLRDWSTPIKAVEYMGWGVPVVGFESPELVATTAGAAELVPNTSPKLMAAAIDRLLSDPRRRRELGERGRRRVAEELAWDHQANRYLQVYGELSGQEGETGQ